MNTKPTFAWLNGRLVPWSEARVPIDDRGLMFSESLYEVLPVTAGRARILDAHAERMHRAALVLGIERGVPGPTIWREIARALVEAERVTEGLLYLQLTGGPAPRMHIPSEPPEPTFFAFVQHHVFPRAREASLGTRAITLPDPRWERCDLKTTMLLPAVLAKKEAARKGVEEALWFGPDGDVREGSSCNVFIVESGRLISPAVGGHVLPGVTRLIVSEIALDAGLRLTEEVIPLARLYAADEVFITSTSRLVLPVLAMDDRRIGSGTPGPVALDLARRLRARLDLDSL